ncbi:MAG: transketolase family protein [Desulfurococcales archaeon]|nr:transketolase family protein [Desulfurococcales archaeon]
MSSSRVFGGSYRRALARALVDLGKDIENLVVLDADTMSSTGSLEFSRRFPERFVNVGISEQDLIGTAAGMAVAGLRPVAVAFSSFIMRAWEQIRNTISRDSLDVTIVGTHAGLSDYMDGSSHQALEDIALMRVLPGFTVAVPADEVATYALTRALIEESRGPSYMRIGRDNAPKVYERGEEFKIGECKVHEDGSDAVIMAIGPMVGAAMEVSRILGKRGLSVGVVDVYSIKPVDEHCIVKKAKDSGLVVTLEEHNVHAGLGGLVAEILSEKLPRRIYRIGVRDRFGTSARSYEELLRFMGLDPCSVAKSLTEVLSLGAKVC